MSLGPVIHDHTAAQSEDAGRRRLRTGAARVALAMTASGRDRGMGLRAEAMADGTSVRNLDRMAHGMNPVTILRPSKRWCKTCRDDGRDPWQSPNHAH